MYPVGEWTDEERAKLIICEKELLASTWGLVALAPWLQDTVVSWTDNTVAMSAMQTMAPRSEIMQEIAAQRTAYLFEGDIIEQSFRITSKANLWADLGSRGKPGEVVRQAAACGLRGAREVSVDPAWRDTSRLCEAAARREKPEKQGRGGAASERVVRGRAASIAASKGG